MKRIVLHIGAPKTGSSALQAALVRNRDTLAERGIFYPRDRRDRSAARGVPTNGNGLPLAKFLNPRMEVQETPWELDQVGAALNACAKANCETLLLSSEYMNYFLPDRMSDFVARTGHYQATVEMVYFIRALVDHALASFSQNVSRGRYQGSFTDYLRRRRYRPYFSSVIERGLHAVGPQNFKVMVYDDVRQRLLGSLVESIGCDAAGLVEVRELINPSLSKPPVSPHQRELVARLWGSEMARVNALVGREALRPECQDG